MKLDDELVEAGSPASREELVAALNKSLNALQILEKQIDRVDQGGDAVERLSTWEAMGTIRDVLRREEASDE